MSISNNMEENNEYKPCDELIYNRREYLDCIFRNAELLDEQFDEVTKDMRVRDFKNLEYIWDRYIVPDLKEKYRYQPDNKIEEERFWRYLFEFYITHPTEDIDDAIADARGYAEAYSDEEYGY